MAGQDAPNRVLSVSLKPGEDVEWLWTSLPFGGRYVSGYRILKTTREYKRLTWEETYRETARAKEDWSDLDATLADGIGPGDKWRIRRPPAQ